MLVYLARALVSLMHRCHHFTRMIHVGINDFRHPILSSSTFVLFTLARKLRLDPPSQISFKDKMIHPRTTPTGYTCMLQWRLFFFPKKSLNFSFYRTEINPYRLLQSNFLYGVVIIGTLIFLNFILTR